MSLNENQVTDLRDAIRNYDYPTQLYDFARKQPVSYKTMRELETELRMGLVSGDPIKVKYALANIVYWGNVQSAYVLYRIHTFLEKVRDAEIHKAMQLFSNPSNISLKDIKRLGLPQFSNMSFVSKLRMFLDPGNCVALDRKLLKPKECDMRTLFHEITERPTYIPITDHNCRQYDKWCEKCRNTANCYFQNSGIIAVDVERGIFHLVDKGELNKAAYLVKCMP